MLPHAAFPHRSGHFSMFVALEMHEKNKSLVSIGIDTTMHSGSLPEWDCSFDFC